MMHFPWIVKLHMKRKAFKLKKKHSGRTDILTQFDAWDPAFSRQNTGEVMEVFFTEKLQKVLQFMELWKGSALVLPIKQTFLNPPPKNLAIMKEWHCLLFLDFSGEPNVQKSSTWP